MRNNEQSPSLFASFSEKELEALADLVAERLGQEMLPQFLDERAAAAFVGLTHRSLQAMRYADTGPTFTKLGDSPQAPVRYYRADLIAWMKTRRHSRLTTENPE
jgi:nucleoside-diphosphate-sugar epimerase